MKKHIVNFALFLLFLLFLLYCPLFTYAQPPPPSSPQQQPIVGVGNMTASVTGLLPYADQQLAAAFQTMLETQLAEVGKFKLIERSRLDQILQEKALGQAHVTNSGESPTNASIQGVDYLIYGTITKLGKQVQGTAINTSPVTRFAGRFGAFAGVAGGGVALRSAKVAMAVDLRITDAHTGEIRYAGTVEEQADAGGAVHVGAFATANSAGDPLADVQRLTAKAITALITTAIYPIKVIAQQPDRTLVLNYGAAVLTVGDTLKAYQLGQTFRDPDTGQVLGEARQEVGAVQVIQVNPGYSVARLLSGTVQQGNVLQRISTAVPTTQAASRGPVLP